MEGSTIFVKEYVTFSLVVHKKISQMQSIS
jgi:hypothetical protein